MQSMKLEMNPALRELGMTLTLCSKWRELEMTSVSREIKENRATRELEVNPASRDIEVERASGKAMELKYYLFFF